MKKGLCPVKKEMLALLQLAKYFVITKELRYKMFLEADEADSVKTIWSDNQLVLHLEMM